MAASGSDHSKSNESLVVHTASAGSSKPIPTRRRRRGSNNSNGSFDKKNMKRRSPRCFVGAVGAIPSRWLVDYRRKQAQLSAHSLLRLQSLVDLDKKKKKNSKLVVDTDNTNGNAEQQPQSQQDHNQSRSSINSSLSSSSSSSAKESAPPSSSTTLSTSTPTKTTSANNHGNLDSSSEHSINLNQVFTETKNISNTADNTAPTTNYEKFSISIKLSDDQEKIQFLLRNPEVVLRMKRALQDKSDATNANPKEEVEKEDEYGNTIKKQLSTAPRRLLRREIKCIIPHDRFQLPKMQMIRQGQQQQQRRFSNDKQQQRRYSNATTGSHQSARNMTAKLHCIEEDYEVSQSEVPYDASADQLSNSKQSQREQASVNNSSKKTYNDNNASKESFLSSCSSFALDSLDSSHETTATITARVQQELMDEEEEEAAKQSKVDRQVEEIVAAVLTDEEQRKKVLEFATTSSKQVVDDDHEDEEDDEEEHQCRSIAENSIAESSVQSSVADSSVQTSVADSSVQTSVADSSVQTSVADTSVQTSVASSVQPSIAESTVADTVAAVVTTLLEDGESEDEDGHNYVSDACYESHTERSHTDFEDTERSHTDFEDTERSHTDFEDHTEFDEDHTEFAHEDAEEDVAGVAGVADGRGDATERNHLEDVTEGAYNDETETEGAYDEDASEYGSVALPEDETEGDYEGDEEEAEDPAYTPLGTVDESDAGSERTGASASLGEGSCITNNTNNTGESSASGPNPMYGLSVYLSTHSTTRDRMTVKGKGGGCNDSRTSITESMTSASRSAGGLDESALTYGTNKTGSTKGTHRTVRSTGTIRSHRTHNSAPSVRTNRSNNSAPSVRSSRTNNSAPSLVDGNDSRSSLCSSKSELDESYHSSSRSLSYEELSGHASKASSAPLLQDSSRSKSVRRRPSLMLGEESRETVASGALYESDSTIGSAVDHRRRHVRRALSNDAGKDQSIQFGRRGSRRFAPDQRGIGLDQSGLIPRSNTPQGTLLRTRSGHGDDVLRPRRLPPRKGSRDKSMDGSVSRRLPARSRSMMDNSSAMSRSRGVTRTKSGHRDSFMGGSKIKKWDSSTANKSGHGLSLLERHLTQGAANAKKGGREKRPSTASRRSKRHSVASMSVPSASLLEA